MGCVLMDQSGCRPVFRIPVRVLMDCRLSRLSVGPWPIWEACLCWPNLVWLSSNSLLMPLHPQEATGVHPVGRPAAGVLLQGCEDRSRFQCDASGCARHSREEHENRFSRVGLNGSQECYSACLLIREIASHSE